MYLTKDKIKRGVACAHEVLAEASIFAEDADMLPISIDAIVEYVEAKRGVKFEIREVVFEAKHLKGRKETYPELVIIEIRSDLSDFWKRFIATKEVLHVLIDKDEDDLSPYGDEILEKLVLDGHIGIISGNGDKPPMQSELVAEIAARETLCPLSERLNDKEKLEDGGTSLAKLELKYELPTAVISSTMDTNYISWIETACS